MRFILIGNYPRDEQESMERFAQMLHSGFQSVGTGSEIWRPEVFFGKWFKTTTSGLGKWLGYLDKWVVFPLILRKRVRSKKNRSGHLYFHVCDHSNSPYLKHLPSERSGITCHDVLAIRGALGYEDAYCPASFFGKILQKWILHHLKRAKIVASVSQLTLNQLQELLHDPLKDTSEWRVIHNAFNADFFPMEPHQTDALLKKNGVNTGVPFLLHVGSGLPRKNRKLLLDMVSYLGNQWDGYICFAGQAVDEELINYSKSLHLQERVFSIVKPDHATLVALYCSCEAFIFPSFSEGFGWPIIEAQACGAPVIASNIEPMPEVSGGGAKHADPNKAQDFAAALILLKNKVIRDETIRQGFDNILHFNSKRMMTDYLKLYGLEPNNSE